MTRILPAFLGLALGASLCIAPPARASGPHFWRVDSPDHGQTFAYGSERNRAWLMLGRDRHLALVMNLTNDPYVDIDNPRQYDDFIFSFPGVTAGKDGRTFYYHTADGRSVPVAVKRPGFLGIDEIRLLAKASLIVESPHGYLSLALIVQDVPNLTDLR